MHARPRCHHHLPEHRYARLNRHRLRRGPGRRSVDRTIAVARAGFAERAARHPLAFSRFHDLMHGIARVADARGHRSPHVRNERPCVHDPTPSGGHHHEHAARPDVSRFARTCDAGAGGGVCLYVVAEPRFFQTRRACRDRREARFVDVRQDRAHGDDAEHRRRVSPLRLECVLVVAVAADRPCVPRAPLPDHSRPALVAHLRDRHEAASDAGAHPQDHRARRNLREDRLFAAAHRALRTRGHLREHAGRRGQGRHRRRAWHLHHGLRDLRRARPLGDRPRPAGQALRLLVEPAARLHGVERMGAAAAIRERDRPGGSAREQVRAPAAFLGPARAAQRADDRSRRAAPDGARGAARARPGARIRIRRRRGRYDQSRRLDLDLVARRRQVPCEENRDDPGRTGRGRRAAAAAARIRRGAAARDRHRPVARRSLPVRVVLGHRRDAPV